MKLTVLQRCKSLLYSRFTGFKVFIFNFGLSHVSKNITNWHVATQATQAKTLCRIYGRANAFQ